MVENGFLELGVDGLELLEGGFLRHCVVLYSSTKLLIVEESEKRELNKQSK